MLVATLSTQGPKLRSAFEYDCRGSDFICVSEAEMDFTHLETLGEGGSSAVQTEQWSTRTKSHDFDIMPAASSTEAGAHRLVKRLFCSETSRQRRQRVGQSEAIVDFAGGK